GRYQFTECIFRNSAGADTARSPNQNTLHSIADNLARNAAGPSYRWSIKAAPFPPVGITASGVHSGFQHGPKGFADLAARHQQAFARLCAGGVKFNLLRIRVVVGEPVLS